MLTRVRCGCLSVAALIAFLMAPDRAAAQSAQRQDVRLTEKALFDGAVTVLIPETFTLMSEELLRLKYPNERRPTVVFSNERGSVNLAANFTTNPVQPEQIPT